MRNANEKFPDRIAGNVVEITMILPGWMRFVYI